MLVHCKFELGFVESVHELARDTLDLKNSISQPFRFSDPRQERIYRRLLLVGSGPAAFYRDACRLMASDPPLAAATHVIAHLLREIESALTKVLVPQEELSGGQSHKGKIRSILKALEIPDTDPVAEAWLGLPGHRGLDARAHRSALGPPRPLDPEFKAFWRDMEAILDAVLERFESHYLLFHRRVDGLLAKTAPTQMDARVLRSQIPNNLVAFGYFFDRLPSIGWLESLKAEGFFKHPPEPERDEEKGSVRFPPWPESRYLARMASEDPETVLEIALQVPDTENIYVHIDLVDAALAMPPEHAARLVERVKPWIKSPYQLLIPEKVGALVVHLAQGGLVDEALDLAGSLLALRPDDRRIPGAEGQESLPATPEPRAWYDDWHYAQILERHIPPLVIAGRERALSLLCDLLDAAVTLFRSHKEGEVPKDYSYIWRPAIEDHPQNPGDGVEDALVSAVRDAAAQIAGNDPATVPALVQALEDRRWRIFHRVALHLLAEFSHHAPELVAQRLTDRARFDDVGLRHEYTVLAQKCFASLSEEDKRKILSWIEEGPDLTKYKAGREAWTGQPPRDEEAGRYARLWRRDHLAPLSGDLPPEWAHFYDELVAELGPAEHPEFVVYSSGIRTPVASVVGAEELRAMEAGEVVSFLESWQPSGDFMGPSVEGLGRELTAAVASDPERFAVEANQFQGLVPDYVSGFICGLRDAAHAKNPFSWLPVLDLCRWVVDQSEETSAEEPPELRRRWRWARELIADLLSHGFGEGASEIPFDLRSKVWEILRLLTEDPDPTPDTEAGYSGSSAGFYELSINTVRGEAMHAVVHYALWVQRHIRWRNKEKEVLAQGFDQMPEVRIVLDRHLDREQDPARSVRAVYGRFFPWLTLLDLEWATASVTKIFPTEETQWDLHNAAWETYVIFCPVYDSVFDVLREEYSRAVNHVSTELKESRYHPDPDERLAEHLMALYWRGKLDLDKPGGILERFYSKASDTLRGDALKFIGHSLGNTEGAVAPQVMERLKALWEHRLDGARRATGSIGHVSELAAFGWWFISGKFDDTWAIAQLREALTITGRTEVDHLVAERLAMLAPSTPLPAVECLSLMIDGDVEGWHIDLWCEHIRAILATVLQSTDQVARKAAISLVHRLAARGYLAFGDLLSEGD